MPEFTIRKTKVSFSIKATGTFVVTCDENDSPAELLQELVKTGRLSYSDLYLHSEEFEWSIEATDNREQGTQPREQDERLKQEDEWARQDIADALDEQWNYGR